MSRIDVRFSAVPYAQPYASVGLELLDNFYVERSASPSNKVEYYYVGIQGLHILQTKATTNVCRGLFTTSSNRTFGVWGDAFVEILTDGTTRVTHGPQRLRTSSGIVRFAENGYQVIAVDGQYGYIFDLVSNQFAQITDPYFPGIDPPDPTKGPSHVACIDTYFLVNSTGTNKYFWSAPGYIPYAFDSSAPTVKTLWWGAQYGEKIGVADNIAAMIQVVSNLFVFGRDSMEVHYDSGDSRGQIFRRQENALANFGCLAPDSVCRYGNEVYWLGRDKSGTIGVFACGQDFAPKRVSLRGVETRIQLYPRIDDCWAYTYAVDGHGFVVFNFPSGASTDGGDDNGATWVYDVTSETWTRRTRWNAADGKSYRYAAQFATQNFGKLIVGDGSSDALYWLDSEQWYNHTPTGEVEWIQGVFTTPITYDNGRMITTDRIQLNHQPGFAPRTGQGSDPVWLMASSNSMGIVFGYERPAPAGKTGHYAQRTHWHKCGFGRNKVFRFRITDPIKRVVVGYTLDFREASR